MTARRVFANVDAPLSYGEMNQSRTSEEIWKTLRSQGSKVQDRNFRIQKGQLTQFREYGLLFPMTRTFQTQFLPRITDTRHPILAKELEQSVLFQDSTPSISNKPHHCNRCACQPPSPSPPTPTPTPQIECPQNIRGQITTREYNVAFPMRLDQEIFMCKCCQSEV